MIDPGKEKALIAWINVIALAEDISSLQQLQQSKHLFFLLRLIDESYTGTCDGEQCSERFSVIIRYLGAKFGKNAVRSIDMPALVHNSNPFEIAKVCMLMLLAALMSEGNKEFVETTLKLDETNQLQVREIVQEVIPPSDDNISPGFYNVLQKPLSCLPCDQLTASHSAQVQKSSTPAAFTTSSAPDPQFNETPVLNLSRHLSNTVLMGLASPRGEVSQSMVTMSPVQQVMSSPRITNKMQLQQRDNTIKRLQKQLNTHRYKADDLEEDLAVQLQKTEKLEKQVTELNHKLKQQSQQKAMELVEAEEQWMAQQRNMADQQHSRHNELRERNKDIKSVNIHLEKENTQLQAECVHFRRQVERYRQMQNVLASPNTTNMMHESLNHLKKALSDCEKERDAAQTAYKNAAQEFTEYKQFYNQKMADYQQKLEMSGNISMLLNRSRGGGGGNDSNAGETMDQVVEKMLKDDLARLEESRDEWQRQAERQNTRASGFEEELGSSKNKIHEYSIELEQMKNANSLLEKIAQQQREEINQLEDQIQKDVRKSEEETSKLNEHLQHVTAKSSSEITALREQSRSQLSQAQLTCEHITQQLQASEIKVSELSSCLQQSASVKAEMESSFALFKTKGEEEIFQMKQTIASLNSDLNGSSDKFIELQLKDTAKQEKLEVFVAELKNTRDVLSKSKEQREMLQEQLRELQKEKIGSEQRIQELQQQLSDLHENSNIKNEDLLHNAKLLQGEIQKRDERLELLMSECENNKQAFSAQCSQITDDYEMKLQLLKDELEKASVTHEEQVGDNIRKHTEILQNSDIKHSQLIESMSHTNLENIQGLEAKLSTESQCKEEMEKQWKRAEEHCLATQAKLKESETRVAELLLSKSTLERSYSELEEKCCRHEHMLHNASTTESKLCADQQQLELKLNEERNLMDKLQLQFSSVQSDLEHEKAVFAQKLTEFENVLAMKETTVNNLTESLRNSQEACQKQQVELQELMEVSRAKANEEYGVVQSKLKETETMVAELTVGKTALERSVMELQEKCTGQEQMLCSASDTAATWVDERGNMEKKLKEERVQSDKLQLQIHSLQTDLQQQQCEATQKMKEFEDDLIAKNNIIQDLTNTAENLKQTIDEERAQFNKAMGDQKAHIQTITLSYQAKLKESESLVSELTLCRSTLERSVYDLQVKCDGQQERMSNASDLANSSVREQEAIETKLKQERNVTEKLQIQIHSLEANLEQQQSMYSQKLSECEDMLAAKETTIQRITETLNCLKEATAEQQAQHNTITSDLTEEINVLKSDTQQQRSEYVQKLAECEKTLKVKDSTIDALTETVDRLAESKTLLLQDLEQADSTSHQNVHQLQQCIDKLVQEKADLQLQVQGGLVERQSLETTLDACEQHGHEMDQLSTELQGKLVSLQQRADHQREELQRREFEASSYEQRAVEAEDKCDSLSQQLEGSQRHNLEMEELANTLQEKLVTAKRQMQEKETDMEREEMQLRDELQQSEMRLEQLQSALLASQESADQFQGELLNQVQKNGQLDTRAKDMESRMESLTAQVRGMQHGQEGENQQLQLIQSCNKQLQEALRHSRNQVEDLEKDLADTRQHSTQVEAQIGSQTEKIASLASHLENLQVEKLSNETRTQCLQQELTLANTRQEALQQALSSSQEKVVQMEKHFNTYISKVGAMEEAVRQGQSDTDQTQKQLKDEIETKEDLALQLTNCKRRLACCEDDFSTERERTQLLEKKIEEMRNAEQSKLTSNESRLVELQESLNCTVLDATQLEGSLRMELGQSLTRETDLQEELDGMKQHLRLLQEHLQSTDESKERCTTLENKLLTSRKEAEKQAEELKAAQNRIAKLEDDVRQAHNGTSILERESGQREQELEADLDAAQDNITELERQITELSNQSDSSQHLQRRIQSLLEQLALSDQERREKNNTMQQLEDRISCMRAQHEDSVVQLQQKLDDATARHQRLKESHDRDEENLHCELSTVRMQWDASDAELQVMSQRLQEVEKARQEADKLREQAQADVQSLQGYLYIQENEFADLKTKHGNDTIQVEKLKEELSHNREISQQDIAGKQIELSAIQQKLLASEEAEKELSEQIGKQHQQIANYEQDISSMKEQCKALKEDLYLENQACERLKEELTSTQASLKEEEDKLVKAENENVSLNDKVTRMHKRATDHIEGLTKEMNEHSEQQLQKWKTHSAKLKDHMVQAQKENRELKELMTKQQEGYDAACEQRAALEEKLSKNSDLLVVEQRRAQEFDVEISALHQQLKQQEADIHKKDLELGKLQVQLDHASRKLRQESRPDKKTALSVSDLTGPMPRSPSLPSVLNRLDLNKEMTSDRRVSSVSSFHVDDLTSPGPVTRSRASLLSRSVFEPSKSSHVPRGFGSFLSAEDEPEALEFGRLDELQRRNTLCLPHMRSAYPVETQVQPPSELSDDQLREGATVPTMLASRRGTKRHQDVSTLLSASPTDSESMDDAETLSKRRSIHLGTPGVKLLRRYDSDQKQETDDGFTPDSIRRMPMPGGVSIPFKLDEESSPLRRAPFRAATLPKPKTPQSAEKLKKGFRKSAFRRTPRRKQIENDESKNLRRESVSFSVGFSPKKRFSRLLGKKSDTQKKKPLKDVN